jgi:branched-chain amino acid transport system ATP-binding protein
MLEVKGIHSYYGTSHILFGISLDVKEGEAVCLLGRNGAGKTTTFRSIIGLTPPKN